jgi:hypothetical protein
MGIFSKWFSKQDKNCSSNFEEENDDDTNNEENKLLGYIVLACNTDGENFVSVDFADGQELKVAELIFLLVSGQMVEETIKSLRKACESEEQAKFILQALTGYMQGYAAQQMQTRNNRPVIDPTEVFSRKDTNEFKG